MEVLTFDWAGERIKATTRVILIVSFKAEYEKYKAGTH